MPSAILDYETAVFMTSGNTNYTFGLPVVRPQCNYSAVVRTNKNGGRVLFFSIIFILMKFNPLKERQIPWLVL